MKTRVGIMLRYMSFAITFIMLPTIVLAAEKNTLSAQDIVEQLLKKYPTVKIAKLEIERARQEFNKIESQLGWVLAAQSGINRDVNAFDIPSDRFDASAQLGAIRKSGSRFDITGQYVYEDSNSTAIPGFVNPSSVNPSERTRLDLSYRIPIGKGEDNPAYKYGLLSAEAGLQVSQASQQKQIDLLISQAVNLYFDAAGTYARIQDANEAVKRASRLLAFVRKNEQLGLAERKDILNFKALLSAKKSERDGLYIAWVGQRSEINKLIGVAPSEEFIPIIDNRNKLFNSQEILTLAYKSNADIALQQAQLEIAESNILLAQDAQKDKLDVVLSVGARNTSGDTASGSVDNDEWAGGARIEYQYSLDQKGFDAELYQAMLQQDVTREEIKRLKHDLKYRLERLLEQVKRSQITIRSMNERLRLERAKVEDSFRRYKVGRSDTNELIDNENSLFISSLAYETRKIELARIVFELDLLQGKVWDIAKIIQK